MQIVTLTTDMGHTDHYVASIKGALLSISPSIQIVDITHNVQSFSSVQAAYFLRSCFEDFPSGTIHIVGVNSEPIINLSNDELSSYPTIVEFKGHFFIGNDNGFFSLLTNGEKISSIWRIDDVLSRKNPFEFPTKNILVPTAAKLANGISISEIASPVENIMRQITFQAIVEPNLIKGNIIHIDHFGNLITNVSRDTFNQFDKDIPFTIYFRKKEYFIDEISSSYSDVPPGEKVAIFNSAGLLEIAVNQGAKDRKNGANTLFGISINEIIRIEFSPRGSKDTLESLF
jgi:S-adenosylmethionine hydrolase